MSSDYCMKFLFVEWGFWCRNSFKVLSKISDWTFPSATEVLQKHAWTWLTGYTLAHCYVSCKCTTGGNFNRVLGSFEIDQNEEQNGSLRSRLVMYIWFFLSWFHLNIGFSLETLCDQTWELWLFNVLYSNLCKYSHNICSSECWFTLYWLHIFCAELLLPRHGLKEKNVRIH